MPKEANNIEVNEPTEIILSVRELKKGDPVYLCALNEKGDPMEYLVIETKIASRGVKYFTTEHFKGVKFLIDGGLISSKSSINYKLYTHLDSIRKLKNRK